MEHVEWIEEIRIGNGQADLVSCRPGTTDTMPIIVPSQVGATVRVLISDSKAANPDFRTVVPVGPNGSLEVVDRAGRTMFSSVLNNADARPYYASFAAFKGCPSRSSASVLNVASTKATESGGRGGVFLLSPSPQIGPVLHGKISRRCSVPGWANPSLASGVACAEFATGVVTQTPQGLRSEMIAVPWCQ
jgi:hypothetical protein